MRPLVLPLFLAGLGVVAIWLYVRFPGLRPRGLTRAIVHVGISFGFFSLVPLGVDVCLGHLPEPLGLLALVCGMLIPALCYVLLSWVWLLALLLDLGNSKPRGGHRVRSAEA